MVAVGPAWAPLHRLGMRTYDSRAQCDHRCGNRSTFVGKVIPNRKSSGGRGSANAFQRIDPHFLCRSSSCLRTRRIDVNDTIDDLGPVDPDWAKVPSPTDLTVIQVEPREVTWAEKLPVHTAAGREIGPFVRARSLGCVDVIPIPDEEEMLVFDQDRNDGLVFEGVESADANPVPRHRHGPKYRHVTK